MMYKNSIRILFSNFNIVWKVLLYTLIVLAVTCGLAYISAVPVFNVLSNQGFFSLIKEVFENFVTNLNLVEFIKGLGNISTSFFEIIINNFSNLWVYIVLFIFIIAILGRFLIGQSKLASAYSLYASMSNNMKVGMLSSYFSNMGKIVLFELTKLIVTFPIDLIIGYVIILCFRLFKFGTTMAILTPFIIVLVSVILLSIRISIFSCWTPMIAVKNDGIFKCLKNNFKLITRRFFKIFANSIGIVLTIIMLNGFALIFTLGVGLIVTIPLSMVLDTTFQMSAYYGSYGMRYYVDNDTIVEPKKMEATEKLKRTKYFI